MDTVRSQSGPAVDAPASTHRDLAMEFLRRFHTPALHFWTDGYVEKQGSPLSTLDLCDTLYTLYLLDWVDAPNEAGAEAFVRHVAHRPIAGGINKARGAPLDVHLSAYVLGSLTLLKELGFDVFDRVVADAGWQLETIIDPKTLCPRWPSRWSHFSWRVSHWVGGTLAILHTLEQHTPQSYSRNRAPAVDAALEAVDELIVPETGFLQCYRSRVLHAALQQPYRLRHDPFLGELGGIVHVHWVNYARGRPFKAGDRLFRAAWRAMSGHSPFMERIPFCLDFDVVHLVRTAMPADLDDNERTDIAARARAYVADIDAFLLRGLDQNYALHRLPGALAAREECLLLGRSANGASVERDPKDLMQTVCWL